jgi:23S rRNA (uracil1939-C5)-methyltransferase
MTPVAAQTSAPTIGGGKNKKRKRNKSSKAPKPGEEGFKTATQLRNARKRRAKQQTAQQGGDSKAPDAGGALQGSKSLDPSSKYLADPQSAPIVRTAKAFFKSLDQAFEVYVEETKGWRTVAKLAVRSSEHDEKKVSIGLFAPNSHKLIPVPNCVAHHPSINEAVAVLERLCAQNDVSAFDEATGKGYLRHVAMNVERATGKVQITLVWNAQPYSDDNEDEGKTILEALTRAIVAVGGGGAGGGRKRRRGRKGNENEDKGEDAPLTKEELKLHSLWVHFNGSWKHANAIFAIDGGADSWKHVNGPKVIVEQLELAGQEKQIALHFPPNVFRQANITSFTNIVSKVRTRITESFPHQKPSAVELYGGVGTIGLNVADLVTTLTSSDENPHNKECFLAAAKSLKNGAKVSYESKNASAMVRSDALEKGQVIIVDPPRKGFDEDVLSALCSAKTPVLLVYVSCGFDAFQRDCKGLQGAGWKLDHAEGHLLFPGSDAIETLAFFTNAKQ